RRRRHTRFSRDWSSDVCSSDLRDFEKRIVKVTKMELPGEAVQFKMAPIERLQELKRIAKKKNTAKKAGVMVLFYPAENLETHLILILRKTYKGVHPAQVGFPGGKLEKEDKTIQDSAVSETEEEVGISSETISVMKKMTEIFIPPSNFLVQTVLVSTADTAQFIPQEEEVEALIEVSLDDIMDDPFIISQILST